MRQEFQIAFRAELDGERPSELFSILERLLPVRYSESSSARPAGILIFGDVGSGVAGAEANGVSTLQMPRGGNAAGDPMEITVKFSDDRDVPVPFRGRCLKTKLAAGLGRLSLNGRQKILASDETGPIWAVSEEGGVKHFAAAAALPQFPDSGNLHDVLNGGRFLEILPLLHWLRETCAPARYEAPPLRACFMFDDPNLHWPRYGFLDFEQIARHAAKENYHVSFATIPLDAWFTHSKAVETFQSSPTRLSLLVHGNDHLKKELARDYTEPERHLLLNQALRRIELFERRSGLHVCRVMVPPHGACVEKMLEALPGCGFEAACISHGSLRAHNRTKLWTKSLGYLQSEVIAGCPVMPRWGLAGDPTNSVLLAAYLGQAIVLMGHHQDLRDGVELLDQLAGLINSLGRVSWANMTRLSRKNYQWRMEGSTCRVRPLGRKVTVQVPSGARRLVIENPPGHSWDDWRTLGINGNGVISRADEGVSLPEGFGGLVSVEVASAPAMFAEDPGNGLDVTAFARRLLTEGRDRFLSRTPFSGARKK